MDLSKAFDFLPHDLLIAKLEAYGLNGSNVHNFADDNTLSDNADCIEELIIKLEGLSDNAIDWMVNNYMIANPAKLHAILLTKSRSNTVDKTLKIKNNLIQSESKVELLGLTIDNRLSFHSHTSSISKKAAKRTQKIGKFLNFTQRKAHAQSFVLTNFNYCPTI